MTDIRELERTGYRAPLALRCLDPVSGSTLDDGLTAVAWPENEPDTLVVASRSPTSSLLGFGSLPGQRAYQRTRATAGQPLAWPAPAAPDPFVVRVTDRRRRYLPVLLRVGVPVSAPVDVPMDSAPARPAPSGWATVRGELGNAADSTSCAWAVVEVDTGTDRYETISDERGRFLIYTPYPEALPPLLGSPPTGPGLGAVTWPLTISVRCEPAALQRPSGSKETDPPELASIRGQASASIDQGGGPAPNVTQTLTFGTALVLLIRVVPA